MNHALAATDVHWGAQVRDILTEAGAAERFARLHGDHVRYDHHRGRWLLFNGHRWVPDDDGAVIRLALTFVRGWQRDALDLSDRGQREDALKFLMRLERRDGLNSLLGLAKAIKPIADSGIEWDAHRWLLGHSAGVVDLRTGLSRAGTPDDRITMSTAVPYDPGATCPRWDRFFPEIFNGDANLIGFMHRAIGYSLCGDTSEQCLFLLHGTGGTRNFMKNVWMMISFCMLGTFALRASPAQADTLTLATRKDANITTSEPAENFGDADMLINNWDDLFRSIGLIEFELDRFPLGTPIDAATLSLFHTTNTQLNATYDIFRITSPWNEGTVTFDTAPSFDPVPVSSLTFSGAPGVFPIPTFRTWDVTAVMQGWIDGVFPNYGLWIEEAPAMGTASLCLRRLTLAGPTTIR